MIDFALCALSIRSKLSCAEQRTIFCDTISTAGGDNEVYASLGGDVIIFKPNSGLDVLHYSSVAQSPATNAMDEIRNFSAVDTIDISDLVNSVTFKGTFSSSGAGEAALSTSACSAFFNTADHAVYVDVNHDGAVDFQHDLGVKLSGVQSIQSFNLIA